MSEGRKKYHIDSIQKWDCFTHSGSHYSLKHLSAHEVVFQGKKKNFRFVVTYGLHVFAKDDEAHTIEHQYEDGREARLVNLERYEASKSIRGIIEKLGLRGSSIYQTAAKKYFIVDKLNNRTGKIEPYKICFALYRENRLLRIHVTSAYFLRKGDEPSNKGTSIYKLAMDVEKSPRNSPIPKEAQNRKK